MTNDAATQQALGIDLPDLWMVLKPDEVQALDIDAALAAHSLASDLELRAAVVDLKSRLIEGRSKGLAIVGLLIGRIGIEGPDADAPAGWRNQVLVASVAVASRTFDQDVNMYALQKLVTENDSSSMLRDVTQVAVPEFDGFASTGLIQTESGRAFRKSNYLVSPDRRTVVTVGFETPNLWLAEEFEELFDDIVATVRVEPVVPAGTVGS